MVFLWKMSFPEDIILFYVLRCAEYRLNQKKKEVSLRINSSTIGMESARSYSSVTRRTAWTHSWTYTGSGRKLKNGIGNGFPEGFLGMEDEGKDAKGRSNAQTTLEDVSLHFRNLSNTGRVSGNSEE